MPPRPDSQDVQPEADAATDISTNAAAANAASAGRPVSDLRPVIDLQEVCCGLVPAILGELARAQADEVDVLIRAGMETEIISGFGSGGQWQLCFQPSFGHGLARFTRRKAHEGPKFRLDTLVY